MRCGAKCFIVEMEVQGEKQVVSVTARTPIDARKLIRSQFGRDVRVTTVAGKRKRYSFDQNKKG